MIAAADTLKVNPAILDRWRDDAAYDYSRELVQLDSSVWDWLGTQLDKLLRELMGRDVPSVDWTAIAIVAGLVLIVGAVGTVAYLRPSFLYGDSQTTLSEVETEDSIYGFDFDAEIAQAYAARDYRQAVRMVYLQTLRRLSDAHAIDWQPFKTPTQYTHELPIPDFKTQTNHFLRVRYGDFPASETMAREMQRLQQNIVPGLGDGVPGFGTKKGGQP